VKPIVQASYSAQLLDFDIWFMLAVSFIFAALVLGYKKITRLAGALFIGAYAGYTIYIYAINFGS
jgi:Ca2+/Na+ antiporter